MWPANKEDEGHYMQLNNEDKTGGAGGGGMLQDFSSEFTRHRAVVVTRLQALREPHCSTWNEDVKVAESALQEMESNRRQVQVQLRLELSGAGNDRQVWEQRLKEWTQEVSSLRRELGTAKDEQSRRSLLGTGVQATQRAASMQATELMEQSSSKLEQARRQALETEEIGMGVLSDLHAQRETIQHMRGNMGIVSDELSSASRSLMRLIRGAEQKKLITMAVAFILGLGLTVYLLGILGLPLKWTVVIAFGLILILGIIVVLRRRNKERQGRIQSCGV